MSSRARIAVWMSEKKLQKFNWAHLETSSAKYNFDLVKLDLSKDIASQGPFTVLLHKLTDVIVLADEGDPASIEMLDRVQSYVHAHPAQLVVIDPIANVRQLLDRYRCYSIMDRAQLTAAPGYPVCAPSFCVITSADSALTGRELRDAGVTYPFICKPRRAHGDRRAHEMTIVFDETHLADCRPNSVAQSFVNHDARLFKLFVIGDSYYSVERPSIKNLYAGSQPSIQFDSAHVSKATSHSRLSVLDECDVADERLQPRSEVLDVIVAGVREAFALDLIGIDVVIERTTGLYAIIDINVFPGYDGFPNFNETLMRFISKKANCVNCKFEGNCPCVKEYKCVQLNTITSTKCEIIQS